MMKKILFFVSVIFLYSTINWSCDPNPEPIEPSYLDTILIKTFTFPGYSSTSISADIEAFIEVDPNGYPGTVEVTFYNDGTLDIKFANAILKGTFTQEQKHQITIAIETVSDNVELSEWERNFLDRLPTVTSYAYSSQFDVGDHRDFIILWYEAAPYMDEVIILEKKE